MNITTPEQVTYQRVSYPSPIKLDRIPKVLGDVYEKRVGRLQERMSFEDLDAVIIYADREHFQNFEYFYGFEPRFEEGLAVIDKKGTCSAILGNECLPLTRIAKIPVRPVLCQLLSMASQPMDQAADLPGSLAECGIQEGSRIGVIGWKLFPENPDRFSQFDIPHYIIGALNQVIGKQGHYRNVNHILIEPEKGIRNRTEPEQAANFEFYSTMVSAGILNAMKHLAAGKSELEIASYLNPRGLPLSCHTNVSAGDRTITGLVSPSDNVMKTGDPFNICWGMRGALSCRAGYLVSTEQELPKAARDYMDAVVKPYFAAAVSWYENIGLDVKGEDMYQLIQDIFPQEKYGWVLNPGHCLGSEEWLNSPVFKDSLYCFGSGQMVQLDIIPAAQNGYYTCNIEDGVLIADSSLRAEIESKYPDVWKRIRQRRRYMKEVLGICLKEETLPLYETQGLLNPYLLNHGYAMVKKIR